jgi:Stage II sporulation protein/Carboxypeptidase regulatory-like domain
MRKRICFAVVLLCIFVAGLSYADTGSLQLSLRDVITGYAVSGTVTFNGPQQLTVPTDENGSLLATLQTGDYIVQTSPQGYTPLTTHYNIETSANLPLTMMLGSTSLPEDERTQQLAPELRPGFTLLHGYIVDSNGKPIAGVRVQLLDAGVETETNANGHYNLSVVTPKERQPGVMGTDTLVFEKSGYEKVVIQNFGIGGEDLRLAPLFLQQGNGVTHRDASHKLSGQRSYEPQSASPAFKLPANVYKQLVTPGKRFSVAGTDDPAGFPSIDVPASIRLGMGPGGPGSVRYVPCASKRTCASVVALNLENYVTMGLPAEWEASWHDDSLKAGAVAYRSYGAWYVANPADPHNKYDICNTTACQVYDPFDFPPGPYSEAAVQATAGVVLSGDNGQTILYAEYAADGNGFACDDGETDGRAPVPGGRGTAGFITDNSEGNSGKLPAVIGNHRNLPARLVAILLRSLDRDFSGALRS